MVVGFNVLEGLGRGTLEDFIEGSPHVHGIFEPSFVVFILTPDRLVGMFGPCREPDLSSC